MSKVKVYYWQGIIVDDLIFAEYQNTLEKLLEGDYQAADLDLKKLKGYRVYTARINQADRLVFTTLEKDGKSYLVVIDVIKNHDYQKASCLNPQVLRAYLERQEDTLKDLITQHDFTAMDAPLDIKGKDNQKLEMQFVPLEYYQGMYLELDTEQKIVVNTQLPAIISGPPGSGKSCLAMAIITQGMIQAVDFSQPIIYVAESIHLREQMRLSWQQHPSSLNRPPNSVLFLSYEELLRRQRPQLNNFAAVDSSFFYDWYAQFELKQQRALQINVHSVSIIYQELCILCAYDKSDYLKLGMRQSIITDMKHRDWLFDTYQSYQGYLNHEKKIDFRLSQETLSPMYPLIVVDEAQDYTASMLTQLSKLAHGAQIAVCMDTLQSIKEIMPHRVRFKLALKQRGINLEEHTLANTYRCSKEVNAVANQWLLIKHALLGGTADKLEFSQVQSLAQVRGEVHWYEEPSNTEWELLHSATQSNHVAVITAEEFRQEAIKLFRTPLVFTPEEIKGLEYQEVVLYRPLMHKIFKKANALLKEKFPEGALYASPYRSRNNQTPSDWGTVFSEIFSACTRAKETLSIVQEKHHGLEFLMQHWQQAFQQEYEHVVKKDPPTLPPMDWQEEILKQRAVGNERVAEEIERQKMGSGTPKVTDLAKPKRQERRKNRIALFAKEKFLLKNNKHLTMELINRADRSTILFAEDEGQSLFLSMLDREACFNLFLEQMQRLEHERRRTLIDEFNSNFMERMIDHLPLLFHVLSRNLSEYMFTSLYTLIKYLPKGSLLQPLIYQGYSVPLFAALGCSRRGRENIRRLRLLNAPLFTDLPGEALTRIYPGTGSFLAFMLQDEVATKPSSFLDNLDKKYFVNLWVHSLFAPMQSFDPHVNGRSLFELIVQYYPDLFGKISIWFEAEKIKALASLNDLLFIERSDAQSIFHMLCASKYALFFLNLLKNQLDDYQLATLFSATDPYGMCALHHLLINLGEDLILNYLKNNNNWLSHLSAETLTRVVDKNGCQYTLLSELCATETRQEILKLWMSKTIQIQELKVIHFTQEFNLSIYDDEKFSAFYLLAQYTEENKMLKHILKANHNLYYLPQDVLFAIKPKTSHFPDSSIFDYLTLSERGQEILKDIIDLNENLAAHIQVQHVLTPETTNIPDMTQSIPLYWLACFYESTKLLDSIINLERFVENAQFREILYKNLSKKKYGTISIAQCLVESESGLNLLLNFLKNDELIYLLLGHNPHKGHLKLDKKKQCEFFNIPEKQAIIYSLLENKRFGAEEIIDLMIVEPITHPENAEKIHNLIHSVPGLWLLNLLCTESARMRKILQIFLYDWPNKKQKNFSLLYELSTRKAGVNLLHLLVQDDAFDPNQMKGNYLIDGKDEFLCPFAELVCSKTGQKLLNLFFQKDPAAVGSTHALLQEPIGSYIHNFYPDTTFFYWLIYHHESTKLLDRFKTVEDRVWAVELSANYDAYRLFTPIEHLEKSASGKALLRELFLRDSFCDTLLDYQNEIVSEVFLDCITNRIQPLLYDYIGYSMLHYLFMVQPKYIDELTAESLVHIMPDFSLGNALCSMTYRASGLDILLQIMKSRPDIAAKITFNDFIHEIDSMGILGFSPLYCLVKTDEAMSTLAELIPLIPSLYHGLRALMGMPVNENMDHRLKLVRQFLDVSNNRELILNVFKKIEFHGDAPKESLISASKHTLFAQKHEVETAVIENAIAPVLLQD